MFEAYPATPTLVRDEIRLLRLLPGAWTDNIQCELVYDTLGDVRPFHALSYVWGRPEREETMLLNGQPFAVTANLKSTLRHLRVQPQYDLLWIDALCINQASDTERTHQVNLMGQIYRSSKGVLVYLGHGIHEDRQASGLEDEAPRTREFLDIRKDVPYFTYRNFTGAKSSLADWTYRQGNGRMERTVDVFALIHTISLVNHLVDIPFDMLSVDHIIEDLHQLVTIANTPWWGRIWVVQEVVLPLQVTVMSGTVSAPWIMFARAASKCLKHLDHCCGTVSFRSRVSHVLREFSERITAIDSLRKTFSQDVGQVTRSISSMATFDHRYLAAGERSLPSLLRRFRDRKASDPRDKVYALLGMVQPTRGRPSLIPDYSLSTAEVYMLAALESIYSSASLSVLTTDNARKLHNNLPSWVPDWSVAGDYNDDIRFRASGLYDTCSTYPLNPDTVKACCKALIVEGLDIDVVKEVGPAILPEDRITTSVLELSSWISNIKRGFTEGKATVNENETLWRLFCADVIFSHPETDDSGSMCRRPTQEDELMFATWVLRALTDPYDRLSFRKFVSASSALRINVSEFERACTAQDELSAKSHLEQDIMDDSFDEKMARAYIWSDFKEDVFFSLFPDLSMRENIIDQGLRSYRHHQEQDLFKYGDLLEQQVLEFRRQKKFADVVKYVSLTGDQSRALDWDEYVKGMPAEGQYLDKLTPTIIKALREESDAKSDDNRGRAWHEVPWAYVKTAAMPQLTQRLENEPMVKQIPKHLQVSLIESSIKAATRDRRPFVTEGGHFGLGPADLRKGDALYLLKGGRTPFILRSCEQEMFFCGSPSCHTCITPQLSASIKHQPCRCLDCLYKRCSNCLMPLNQARECSDCVRRYNAHSCYQVIGDCYAVGFMDSHSVDKYIHNLEGAEWKKIHIP